jgi:hypothetical protein
LGRSSRARVLLTVVALVLCALSGCVRRRMTIVSNPPGAAVYVDNQQIGTTPVSTSFTYYGTRNVTLVLDGYETQTVKHTFHTPWYQIPPLDLASESLYPGEIRDERLLDFTLAPQPMVSADAIWRAGENLRASAQQGYVAPLPLGGSPTYAPPVDNGAPLVLPTPPVSDAGRTGPWR